MVTHQRTNRRGFTIVEMLAVMGIIAILIAILLPALSGARRNTLWAKSQANLRQVGQLLVLYATDNREAIAPTAFDYRTLVAPGKVRSASPPGIQPPIGQLSVGSWTDILWTSAKYDPIVNLAEGASTWDYRFDSPDATLYASGWSGVNPFRSEEPLRKIPPGGTGATPFGTGPLSDEIGDPGYFGGNPFFDARPPTLERPYSGSFWATGQIKRPEVSMYCMDSNLGEMLDVTDPSLNPGNPNLDLKGVEWRYTGNSAIMLLLDGHVETVGQWEGLRELEKDLGFRVLGLDKRSFFQ